MGDDDLREKSGLGPSSTIQVVYLGLLVKTIVSTFMFINKISKNEEIPISCVCFLCERYAITPSFILLERWYLIM